ncbi:MAG: flavodoxin family protein, partial [Lachnospiraceae bacterium]
IYQAIPDSSKDIQRLLDDNGDETADTYFIGFWTDRGTCSMEVLDYLSELHDKNIALFGTCGFGTDESYYQRIGKEVSVWIPDDSRYCGTFMCQGKMPMSVRNKYEQMLENKEKADKARKMIRNFDEALLHPNKEDFEQSDIFVNNVIHMLKK